MSTPPALCHRRAPGGHGSHRTEDHCGYLRRVRPPRRRRVLRKGPHQGGPLRGLRRPVGGQNRGGRRAGQAVPDSAGLRHRCGQPVSILVETFGTGTVADEVLEKAVRKTFDLRPTAIIRDLGLQKPIYRQLAAYGHMGREDLGVLWEKTDRAEQLKAACQ